MTPAQIIQWIQFALLILRYGKRAVDLAVDVYERTEFAARARKVTRGEITGPAEKAASFGRVFRAESSERVGISPPAARVAAIREGVWKTRPENRGKEPKR